MPIPTRRGESARLDKQAQPEDPSAQRAACRNRRGSPGPPSPPRKQHSPQPRTGRRPHSPPLAPTTACGIWPRRLDEPGNHGRGRAAPIPHVLRGQATPGHPCGATTPPRLQKPGCTAVFRYTDDHNPSMRRGPWPAHGTTARISGVPHRGRVPLPPGRENRCHLSVTGNGERMKSGEIRVQVQFD